MRKRGEDKVFSYTICLRGQQITWLDNHPDFKIHKFFREQLDKLIMMKTKVEEL